MDGSVRTCIEERIVMKLIVIACSVILILLIPMSYVSAQNPCYGCGKPQINATTLQQAREELQNSTTETLSGHLPPLKQLKEE